MNAPKSFKFKVDLRSVSSEELVEVMKSLQILKSEPLRIDLSIEEIFNEFDKDNNNELDKEELLKFFTMFFEDFSIIKTASKEFVNEFLEEFDFDKSQSIDREEIQKFLTNVIHSLFSQCQEELDIRKNKEIA